MAEHEAVMNWNSGRWCCDEHAREHAVHEKLCAEYPNGARQCDCTISDAQTEPTPDPTPMTFEEWEESKYEVAFIDKFKREDRREGWDAAVACLRGYAHHRSWCDTPVGRLCSCGLDGLLGLGARNE